MTANVAIPFLFKGMTAYDEVKITICCGLDVHKKVSQLPTNKEYLSIIKILFLLSTHKSKVFTIGSSKIIFIMFSWNPPESIGFLFLIISKITLTFALLVPSMSKLSRVRKPTKRILSGLLTSTILTLSNARSFYQKISGSSVNLQESSIDIFYHL